MTRLTVFLASLVLVSACGTGKQPSEAAEAPAASITRGAAREIHVPPDLQKRWGLLTGPVSRMTMTGAVTLTGVVALNQQRTAQITSLLEGRVMTVGADLGDQVRKGQALLAVHSPALAQAQQAFLQAAARRTLAGRELERAKALLADEAIQQKEVQRRQAEFDAASTEYGLAESQLHSFGWDHPQLDQLLLKASQPGRDMSELVDPTLTLRAPIDGRVIARDVLIGEHVHPDKLLFVISDLSIVWALLDARETDLPSVTAGSRVAITSEVYGDRTFEGRVARIGDVVDEKLRTVKVRVDLPNPGLLLKPNMFVRGALDSRGSARQALGVPEDAIQTIEGEPAVFVLAPDGGFTVKPVAIGERVGRTRAITGGLDGREVIVTAGAFSLKAELLKSSFAGE
jgi:cobalt-zinc-cadmium efflux system membrane fusion protein